MKKIIFLVLDGLGDESIPDFEGKTPLEKARTPNLDRLALLGQTGLLEPAFSGALPTSEEGHLQLFGYDPQKIGIRRGFFTSRGAGIKTKPGDVALRGNFATINSKGEVTDRRAGRIKTKKARKLVNSLGKIKVSGVRFLIESATDHRLGIVMRGEGLSPHISDTDTFYSTLSPGFKNSTPKKETPEAAKTSRALNEFLKKAKKVLKNHPVNKKREKKGLPPANAVLTRSASSCVEVESFFKRWGFKAFCVAGKPLYKQVAEVLGMKVLKVKGATGHKDTDLEAKVAKSLEALRKGDFVFTHIKATDSLAEDGDWRAKKEFLEKVDEKITPFLELEKTLVVVTSDHSTCSLKKRHCDLPCPVLIKGGGKDEVEFFSEKECRKGELGKFPQIKLMEKVKKEAL